MTFNELRDLQHSISRKRDGIVKLQLQKKYNDRKKHSFLYGYVQSENDYGSRRLVGKKEDNIFQEDTISIDDTLHQKQSEPRLVKKLTVQKKIINR